MRLSGSITALATPFTVTGELDLDAWRRLLHAQIEGGTQAVVVAGSTGEAASLYESEHDALLRTAVECVAGRVPVLAGTGQPGTARTIEATRRAAALGADAALVVVPPYVRPTQAGLLAHFKAIADDDALPLVMYNVPQRTGCDLLPDTVAGLVAHPRIVGIKEASADPARMQAWLALRDSGFAVLCGDDATAARGMLAGADGLVSVVANIIPAAIRRLCDLARAGQGSEAEAWNAQLAPFFDFATLEPNPIPVKAVLDRLGFGRGVRLPLTPLPDTHQAVAARIATAAEAIEHSLRDPLAA
ncbi:4-hydroxy-tetrahydrodipicolinate synthase [Luteimonas viscosa]|uniref:4-hydroxy-tetrahydrodipicolinate synthase n=1 Tax=Luteimonas viscosa TaxID=1132694 RepID=A0A5D4XMK6_9GAMM|nr:4-hydroxy-tetrahydrodipicolinate synthase [Luteimonas viscosa]TYT25173.1 4-hydroxy-tetrahydrodipicolinate synthase [Luteimonas viscosa]